MTNREDEDEREETGKRETPSASQRVKK